MKITITAHQHIYNGGTAAYARVYCSNQFLNDDNETVDAGTPPSNDYVKQVAVTTSNGVVTIPSFATSNRLDSTIVTATGHTLATYTLTLHDANGNYLTTVFENIKIPASPTTTSWADLAGLAASTFIPHRANYFDSVESDRRYLNNGAVALSSDVVYGRARASALPSPLADPTFVEANTDPAWVAVKQTKYANAYASLAAVILDIGVTETELVIATTVPVPANATLPANIRPKFTGNGKFDISPGRTLTIKNGAGLQAPPDKQIFSGAGTVKFDASYPIVFHPEWWGALGDNSTDDLAAFNAMFASMQYVNTFVSNTLFAGGFVRLTAGKVYYCSSRLNIRRPVLMEGMTAEHINRASCFFRFPANTQGIVLHAQSTVDGVSSTTQSAQTAELRGFAVIGAQGANNSAVSTNGLNLTITGGDITAVSQRGNNAETLPAISPGTTVDINGFAYVIASTLAQGSTATVPIQPPRVLVTTDGTSTIAAAQFTAFPSNNDWAGRTIVIRDSEGKILVSTTITSHTTTSMVLGASVAAVSNVTATITNGIKSQTGQNARFNIYHGIDVRIMCKLKNILVYGFAGNGVEMHSEKFPSSGIGTEPNCNNSEFDRVNAWGNAGSGFNLFGINSNNLDLRGLNSENNNGYGIHEEGTSGSNYNSFHIAYNKRGAFRMVGGVAVNQIASDYTEGEQPSAIVGSKSFVRGGNMGAGFDQSEYPANFLWTLNGKLQSTSGLTYTRAEGERGGVSHTKAHRFEIGTVNTTNMLFGFGAGEEAANLFGGFTANQPEYSAFQFVYDGATGRYNLNYDVDTTTTPGTVVLSFLGSNAPEGGGFLALPNTILAGITNQRKWHWVTAKPTTGTAAQGDIYWNIGDATECVGWICTTAGNLATSGVVTPFGATLLESITGTAGSLARFASGASGGLKLENATVAGADVSNTPAGGIAAITVQAAINELDTEKAPKANPTFSGTSTNDVIVGTSLNLGGSTLLDALTATAVLNFPSIPAQDMAELTITVTGAASGDDVRVTPTGSPENGLSWCGFVSAADTVTVRLTNTTVGAIDPASRTWRATVFKF